MDIEFPRYERNEACRRIDLEFVARFSGAIPSREEVRAELALISGADPAAIALDRLSPRAKKVRAGEREGYTTTRPRCRPAALIMPDGAAEVQSPHKLRNTLRQT